MYAVRAGLGGDRGVVGATLRQLGHGDVLGELAPLTGSP